MRPVRRPILLTFGAVALLSLGVYLQSTPPDPVAGSLIILGSPQGTWHAAIPVPDKVKVTAESDRDHYFLGENPLIHLTVQNLGRKPFRLSVGGDYRGGTRCDRFKISVRDDAGRVIPDPLPKQINMGGMGGNPMIKPGESVTISTPLMRYALIERPGTYSIEIGHDFGWIPTTKRPIPTAGLSLRFSEPDEAQARAILAATSYDNRLPSLNSRSEPFGDYTCLRFPVYLPLLQDAATTGNTKAVLVIGHIPGPAATAALLALAEKKAATMDIRRAALDMLADRAPYPPNMVHYTPQLVIAPERLRDGAWTDSLRADTLRLARTLLTANTAAGSDLTAPAIDLVSALGSTDDAADPFLAILDANLIDTLPEGGVTHSQNERIFKSIQALQTLHQKGWPLPSNPTRPSEVYLTFHLVERGELPHSAEIERLALTHLSHPSLILRRTAYDAIRHTVPESYLPQIRSDFALDTDGLRDGVRSMIWLTHDLRLLPDLLARLENNRDRHQQGQLTRLALELAGPRTVIPILITQLNHPSIAREALDELARLVIELRFYRFLEVEWTQPELDALQATWREFYERHKERIVSGEKFASEDSRVPAALFGGRYDWSPRPPP